MNPTYVKHKKRMVYHIRYKGKTLCGYDLAMYDDVREGAFILPSLKCLNCIEKHSAHLRTDIYDG